ncbi:MAG: NAD(P)/FAD-dependent oxidoreductase [Armatimonadetes bacterium]|nr:NAD(P)/FAD-dependent oxidoreductase [Armatimonadota bacterium]
MLREEMGFQSPTIPEVTQDNREKFTVIIGAGLSGIAAAIQLQRLGQPYIILEKNDALGGTWYENTYPEAGVDTPNHFYSFTFASEYDWEHYFSKQPEVLKYLHWVAERESVTEHIRFGAKVTGSTWNEDSNSWETRVDGPNGSETIVSDLVVTAVGQLNQPKLPEIPGLETFKGSIFHTAQWPGDIDLAGKRVALIGSGASAVQAARSIAATASSLTVFQRSPQWLMPNPDYLRSVSEAKRRLIREVPYYAAWYRFTLFWRYADGLLPTLQIDPAWEDSDRSINAVNDSHRRFLTRYMEKKLEGRPDLLEKALPDYPPYGKRMVVDNDWFDTLLRENVELVTDGVAEVSPSGVRTDRGDDRDFDVIIFATGFQATRMLGPLNFLGRGGRSLHEYWNDDDPKAYLGMTVPGFPNLFLLLGPNTALAHGGSVIFHVEAQVSYVAKCIAELINSGCNTLEPTEEACTQWTDAVAAAHRAMVFSHQGMSNWYKNSKGRVVTVSPWRLVDYWSWTREPDFEKLVLA